MPNVGWKTKEHENRERQRRTRWQVTRRVVKRAWRTMSPHDTRAARRSESDERQGRAADLANRASAAPEEEARNTTTERAPNKSLHPTRADGIVSAGG